MWKNNVQSDRTQLTMLCLHIAYSISKATNTHSEYKILFFHCNNGCAKAPQHYIIWQCLSCLEFLTLLDSFRKTAVT